MGVIRSTSLSELQVFSVHKGDLRHKNTTEQHHHEKCLNPQIEAALLWLSQGTTHALEYVTDGEVLAWRLLALGTMHVDFWVDSEEKAKVLRKKAGFYQALNRVNIICSENLNVEYLFDAVIIQNAFDGIYPEDIEVFVENIWKHSSKKAKILCILPFYSRKKILLESGATEMDQNFFLLPSGKALWDMPTPVFLSVWQKYFSLFSQAECADMYGYMQRLFLFLR